MKSLDLRSQCGAVFDYQTLLAVLKSYASPRDKISDLLRQKIIIRVKKGLYVFGEGKRERPYSLETLANLIYGPSYISLDYALQIHGLIPERVETVSSVTLGRSRSFATPVGNFIYRKIKFTAYADGVDLVMEGGNSYLLAVPEKALVDKLQSDRGLAIRTQIAMEQYLIKNLRMEISDIVQMDPGKIERYGAGYRSRKAGLLAKFIYRLQNKTAGRMK